jgi:hypothetical protein
VSTQDTRHESQRGAADDAPDYAPMPDALRAEVARDLAALRARRVSALGRFGVLALLLAVVTGAAMGVRPPLEVEGPYWLGLLGYAVCGLLLFGLAFGITLPAGRRLGPVCAATVVGSLALLATFVVPDAVPPANPTAAGMGCMVTGLVTSITLMVAALYLGRGLLRRHAPTGLLLGAAAGVIGLIPLHIFCEANDGHHLMVWHSLVPVLAAVLAGFGWALIRRAEDEHDLPDEGAGA